VVNTGRGAARVGVRDGGAKLGGVNRFLCWLVPVCLALCSCSGGGPRDGGLDARPQDDGTDLTLAGVTVELGTGQTDWEDLPATNARDELIYGAQGGYHVWGRARFHGFAPDVDVFFQAVRLSDGATLHMPQPARRWIADGVRRGLEDEGGGTFSTDAELVILSIACAREVVGQQLQVRVFVRERASGRVASDSRVVTVVDEVPSPACATPSG
jgi:hypothetical protein